MLDTPHGWLALMVFTGAVILPALYLYALAARKRRRREARHRREDSLRRHGA